MLLEIAEPTNEVIRVGIDFGTTNSLIAMVTEEGCVVLPDPKNNNLLLPSIVSYVKDEEAVIGDEAQPNSIRSIKRTMAEQLSLAGKTNIEIASAIFAALRDRAVAYCGKQQLAAVVTVPAYFGDAARHAIKQAAQNVGIEVLRLLNEPTAAAYAYGVVENFEGLILVYDLGGGTFDVSILRLQKGVCEVIATGGDSKLGGDDVDWALHNFLAASGIAQDHMLQARAIKEHLCHNQIWSGDYGGHNVTVNQQQLNEIAAPYLEKTMAIIDDVLRAAKLTVADIEEVLLVGGSTNMPMVKQLLMNRFSNVKVSSEPQMIVAKGAAIKANQLGKSEGDLLIDVTPLSLGVELLEGFNEIIIPRNTPLPAHHRHTFTTGINAQTAFIINILQGESPYARDCRILGTLTLHNLPPLAAGEPRLEVIFDIDANGILTVEATELISNRKQIAILQPQQQQPTPEEIAQLLRGQYHPDC